MSALAFIGKNLFEGWLDRNLETYKSILRKTDYEHEKRFGFLYEKQATIIAELYRLIVEMTNSFKKSAEGIHQYVDNQVLMPRDARQSLSVQYYNNAVNGFRAFESYLENNSINLSESLIVKLNEFKDQSRNILQDLEISHSITPPNSEGLPPSIEAIWVAQKKLRLSLPPIKKEIETEFRKILGTIENISSK